MLNKDRILDAMNLSEKSIRDSRTQMNYANAYSKLVKSYLKISDYIKFAKYIVMFTSVVFKIKKNIKNLLNKF